LIDPFEPSQSFFDIGEQAAFATAIDRDA